MLKKLGTLVVPGLLSAALLYLGTMVMGQVSPALASTLTARVARLSLLSTQANLPARTVGGEDAALSLANGTHKNPTSVPVTSDDQEGQNIALPSVSATTSITGVAEVTIAELTRQQFGYHDQAVSVAGLVSVLNDSTFLLNDGTGQVMVKVERHDLVNLAGLHGKLVRVTGRVDDQEKTLVFKLQARSLSYDGLTVHLGDINDDSGDLDDQDDDVDQVDDDDQDDGDTQDDDDNKDDDTDDDLEDTDSDSGETD